MRIFFRIVVILLALGGTLGAGFLALVVQGSVTKTERDFRDKFGVASVDDMAKSPQMQLVVSLLSPRDIEKLNEEIENTKRVNSSLWFLYAATGLGLLGVVLLMFGQGLSAAILLLVAAVGPMVLMPPERLIILLLFLGAMPLAGLLAFFVRPKARPILAPAEA